LLHNFIVKKEAFRGNLSGFTYHPLTKTRNILAFYKKHGDLGTLERATWERSLKGMEGLGSDEVHFARHRTEGKGGVQEEWVVKGPTQMKKDVGEKEEARRV
jgi:hypothetical protein